MLPPNLERPASKSWPFGLSEPNSSQVLPFTFKFLFCFELFSSQLIDLRCHSACKSFCRWFQWRDNGAQPFCLPSSFHYCGKTAHTRFVWLNAKVAFFLVLKFGLR